jgi:hypothetical protein
MASGAMSKLACALVYFLLVYGIVSLFLTILVNDEILYVTIDAIVSIWSYVFFVFNPFPMLYRLVLVLQHGPSVWINSTSMTVILFIYPVTVIAIGLMLFYKYGGFIRGEKWQGQDIGACARLNRLKQKT